MNVAAFQQILKPIQAELAEIRERLKLAPALPTPSVAAASASATASPAPAPFEPETLAQFGKMLDALPSRARADFYKLHAPKFFGPRS